ncbi:hypothetical protein CEW92_08470 [Bacillaceae bacterium SAS-127]|nr:hypothetical protein CEW92_08470 [Bacillaceae bacterium SAS-127]
MAFGQHQTFYLRLQWLYKGLKEIRENPCFFYDPDHFETLGVGKNMAQSIKHWLQATKVAVPNSKRTALNTTKLGEIILKHDPYLQKPFTIALLHNELVRDEKLATTWYWFFNIFEERVFDKELALTVLTRWVNSNQTKAVSANSLKRDIDCLFALYVPKEYVNATPEDVIKSPFEDLQLLSKTVQQYYLKKPLNIENIEDVLFIMLVQYCSEKEVSEISLEELVNGEKLWGRVFNLSRSEIVEMLENIQQSYPVIFTRTNRLDIVRLLEKQPRSYLQWIERFYSKEEVFQ